MRRIILLFVVLFFTAQTLAINVDCSSSYTGQANIFLNGVKSTATTTDGTAYIRDSAKTGAANIERRILAGYETFPTAIQLSTFSYARAGFSNWSENFVSGILTIGTNAQHAAGSTVQLQVTYGVESLYNQPVSLITGFELTSGTQSLLSLSGSDTRIEYHTVNVIAGGVYDFTIKQLVCDASHPIAAPTMTAVMADFNIIPEPATAMLFTFGIAIIRAARHVRRPQGGEKASIKV